MPNIKDFSLSRGDNADLVVNLAPAAPIGGMSLSFNVGYRFGGNGNLIQASIASGIPNGASGITIQNSGQGVYSIALSPNNTSGLDYGNYAYWTKETSPSVVTFAEGYLILTP